MKEGLDVVFVEQFPDLGWTSAWNTFRDISAPIFDLLVIENNRYASQKKNHLFTVSSSETIKLVGLIILSAYSSRLNIRGYWSKSKTLCRRAFTAHRADQHSSKKIKSYIHMSNNNTSGP